MDGPGARATGLRWDRTNAPRAAAESRRGIPRTGLTVHLADDVLRVFKPKGAAMRWLRYLRYLLLLALIGWLAFLLFLLGKGFWWLFWSSCFWC